MKRTLFFSCVLATQSVFCIGQTATIYFEKDSSSITLQAQSQLDSLIGEIKQSSTVFEIGIIGHTDADASDDYNKVFALNSAWSAVDYLEQNDSQNTEKSRFKVADKTCYDNGYESPFQSEINVNKNDLLRDQITNDSIKSGQIVAWTVMGQTISVIRYEYIEDELYYVENSIDIVLNKENAHLEKLLPPRNSEEIDEIFTSARRWRTERFDTIHVESDAYMDTLAHNAPITNWLNSTRSKRIKKSRTDLIVEYNEDFIPVVSLFLVNFGYSERYSYREGNKVVFKNIPMNREYKLLGLFKKSNQNKIYFAGTSGKITESGKVYLNFELLDQSQVKERLDGL